MGLIGLLIVLIIVGVLLYLDPGGAALAAATAARRRYSVATSRALMVIVTSDRLAKELEVEGLIPEGCRLLEVVLKPGTALVIRYEVHVTEDDYIRFARAFKLATLEPDA